MSMVVPTLEAVALTRTLRERLFLLKFYLWIV
jgi:hypothetical protein